ncbi:MAG: protein-methionine-sulfoxide reductase catalytic subunit MsrP, partial [Acidobacteriota bacterium]|nr:protein-methionine-sulfoxide reductase catalytic subunit MsrP [Acidobacteriota bacterium]
STSLGMTRRALLASAAFALAACGSRREDVAATIPRHKRIAPRNARYTIDRPLTDEIIAASYNNFYEFTSRKDVWRHVGAFQTDRWSVEVTGLVAKPRRYALEELLRFAHEERLYRHRCVETWSMAIPWVGFPLSRLLLAAEPRHDARYVRFLSFSDPQQQPAVKERPWERWPYYEGLRIDEAMHDLTFVATGMYGHKLPPQHGAPVRIVVPWKYGYKSPKSVVRIELVAERPHTFWEDLAPTDYPFESNVDPSRPHPRWSQATERLLGTFDVRRTLPYNGYGELVRHLYV